MNTVNKEVAIKLKEAGFTKQCNAFFTERGDGYTGDHCNCPELVTVSRPDCLTAADWIFQNLSLEIIFSVYKTKVFSHITGEYLKVCGGDGFDHRNEALLFALNQIKK